MFCNFYLSAPLIAAEELNYKRCEEYFLKESTLFQDSVAENFGNEYLNVSGSYEIQSIQNYELIEKRVEETIQKVNKNVENSVFFNKYSKERSVLTIFVKEYVESSLKKQIPVISYSYPQILFSFLDDFSLDDFQRKYFEPFNLKFPDFDLQLAPFNIKYLDFSNQDIKDFDFERFSQIEEINLNGALNVSPQQINQISKKIKHLYLAGTDVSKRKSVHLRGQDLSNVCFSRFQDLETLEIPCAMYLTSAQINEISPTVTYLNLGGVNVSNVDFTRFKNLKKLVLFNAQYLTAKQINEINSKIEYLDLTGAFVLNVDFSRFTDLKEIDLSRAEKLTEKQRLQISDKMKCL